MLRTDLEDLHKNGQIGDWCFMTEKSNGQLILWLRYPVSDPQWQEFYREAPELNRGDLVAIPVTGDSHHAWQWDGNREAPTLTPSINVIGRWHGWLREGKLVSA